MSSKNQTYGKADEGQIDEELIREIVRDELPAEAADSTNAFPRRSVLAALGVAGAGAMTAGMSGTAAAATNGTAESIYKLNDSIYYVGANGGYDTIQEAHTAIYSSGTDPEGIIYVTDSYDTSLESYPIQLGDLNGTTTRVMVTGDKQTEIGPGSATSNNVIEIKSGPIRPPGVVLKDISVEGGNHGIVVEDSRFTQMYNVYVGDTGGIGVFFRNVDSTKANNTHYLHGVEVQRAGTHGFRIQQSVHNVNLVSCAALESTNHGVWNGSNASFRIAGGQYERNGRYGFYMDGSESYNISDAYSEDNYRNDTTTPENLLTGEAGVVEGCYFNGLGNSDNCIHVDGFNIKIRDNRFKNYNQELIKIASTARNTDVSQIGNRIAGETLITPSSDSGIRTRSNAIIGAQHGGVNLGNHDGITPGDLGMDDGSNTSTQMLCIWTGSAWQPVDGGNQF